MQTAVRFRIAAMAILVACLAGQAWLVYSDDTGRETPPLSQQALAGRAIWHEHNCQSCHQLYGFGGFIGPDLTNAAPRISRARAQMLLRDGSGQMPAFQLDEAEVDAVLAFLAAIDSTGIGQARHRSPGGEADKAVHAHLQDAPMTAEASAGREVFFSRCVACHMPMRDNLAGSFSAPDPTTITARLSETEILAVLHSGRPERGMPPQALRNQQRRELLAFLEWMEKERATLERLYVEDGGGLPWFNFR